MSNKNTDKNNHQTHKNIPKPSKWDQEIIKLLDSIRERSIKILGYEKKGEHGTNWQHAMSMLTDGIKTEIPDGKRTSNVTPKGHKGFYVDTSKDGQIHAKEFAEMATYGRPNIPSDEDWLTNFKKAQNKHDIAIDEFKEHKSSQEKDGKSSILEVWGPKNLKPTVDNIKEKEAIYLKGASEIIVKIKKNAPDSRRDSSNKRNIRI